MNKVSASGEANGISIHFLDVWIFPRGVIIWVAHGFGYVMEVRALRGNVRISLHDLLSSCLGAKQSSY